ncbi:MAG: hypothetical protein CSA82_00905 [Actinobacteria bacterium]|nr:MAG: hypothetical protein CSA82_00905 [Actinomycetota bacterium]
MSAEEAMPMPVDCRGIIEDLAADFERVGRSVSATQVASMTNAQVPGWIGEAADAYTESISTLGAHARDLAPEFGRVSAALRSWGDKLGVAIDVTVPTLWDDYEKVSAAYESNIAWLSGEIERRSSTETPMSQMEVDFYQSQYVSTRDGAHEALVRDYKRAMDRLDDEAGSLASEVRGVQNGIVNPTVAEQGRDAIGAELFNDIPLVDGQATWEFAQSMAPEIADAMRQIGTSDESLEEFYNTYGRFLEDPFFANALMEEMTAEEVYAFSMKVAPEHRLSLDPESLELRDKVLAKVGTAMVLSTGGTNADPAYAANQQTFDAVRDGLIGYGGKSFDELVTEQIGDYRSTGREWFETSKYNPDRDSASIEGYSLWTQLTGVAARSNPNLALGAEFYEGPGGGPSMASDLVTWDHETGQADYAQRAGLLGAYNPALLVDGDPNVIDPLQTMYLLSDTPDALEGGEGAAATQAIEQERLASMRRFLSSGTSFDVDVNNDGKADSSMNMARYLTGNRAQSNRELLGFQDGGEAFGNMINDATQLDNGDPPAKPDAAQYPGGERSEAYQEAMNEYAAWQSDDKARAEVAAQTMAGYQDGLSRDHDTGWFENKDQVDGQDIYGYTNKNLRSWMGSIMAPHMSGIASSLGTNDALDGVVGATYTTDGHAEVNFDRVLTNRLLARGGLFSDLAFDNPAIIDEGDSDNPFDDVYENGRRPALDLLRVAAYEGYSQDLHEANGFETPEMQQREMREASTKWATATNSLFVANADRDSMVAHAMDERNRAWQDGIGAVISAVPFSEIVDNKVTGYLIGQAKDNLLEPTVGGIFRTDYEDAVSAGQSVQHFAASAQMEQALYGAVSENDSWVGEHGEVLDGREIYAANEGKKHFMNPDGTPIPYSHMDMETREQFKEFIQDDTTFPETFSAQGTELIKAEMRRRLANAAIYGEKPRQVLHDDSGAILDDN